MSPARISELAIRRAAKVLEGNERALFAQKPGTLSKFRPGGASFEPKSTFSILNGTVLEMMNQAYENGRTDRKTGAMKNLFLSGNNGKNGNKERREAVRNGLHSSKFGDAHNLFRQVLISAQMKKEWKKSYDRPELSLNHRKLMERLLFRAYSEGFGLG